MNKVNRSTCLDTNPSLFLSIILKILSMWDSSPKNSENESFPSKSLSSTRKNPSTSLLKLKWTWKCLWNIFFTLRLVLQSHWEPWTILLWLSARLRSCLLRWSICGSVKKARETDVLLGRQITSILRRNSSPVPPSPFIKSLNIARHNLINKTVQLATPFLALEYQRVK